MALDALPTGLSPPGVVNPWSTPLIVGANLRNFYRSQGDKTFVGANTIATLLDGPEKVVRYDNLVIGDGSTASSLSALNRCKGLTIICNNLTVKNNASLNMTGKGARVLTNDDPNYPFIDFLIPNQITLASSQITLAQALAVINANGFAPWDTGAWQSLLSQLYGFTLTIAQAGAVVLLSAAGCGAGGGTVSINAGAATGTNGTAGSNGGMGGGGGGGIYSPNNAYLQYSRPGKPSSPYGGGAGAGGTASNGAYSSASAWSHFNACIPDFVTGYSGPGGNGYNDYSAACGGGAGNPPGAGSNGGNPGSSGVGGKLVIIALNSVTVNAGGKIEANGMPGGGNASVGAGSGSGGGHISVITPTLTNAGTIQAAGGGPGGSYGASGGTGSVVTKTPTQMGW